MSNFLSRWVNRLAGKPDPEASPDTAPAAPSAATPTSSAEITTPSAVPVAPSVPTEARPPALPEVDLSGIEKQMGKLGREQFKLNALIELLQQQAQTAQQQLSDQAQRHDQIVADLRTSHQITLKAEVAETRLQAVLRTLPALDGLEEALVSGGRLLNRMTRFAAQVLPPQGIHSAESTTLLLVLPAGFSHPRIQPATLADASALQLAQIANFDHAEWAAQQDAYAAWLKGLGIIRTRLLDALAREGVRPIEAVGQAFDPNRHIAVDVVSSSATTPPGNIASETRRGYALGERILRYAEVVVARSEPDSPMREPEHTLSDIEMDDDVEIDVDVDVGVNDAEDVENRMEPPGVSSIVEAALLSMDSMAPTNPTDDETGEMKNKST